MMNRMMPKAPPAAAGPTQEELLTQIRDALRKA
jgi:large-conductance mechanosensitive channel